MIMEAQIKLFQILRAHKIDKAVPYIALVLNINNFLPLCRMANTENRKYFTNNHQFHQQDRLLYTYLGCF